MLRKKVGLMTGAASGIGRAKAVSWAREGFKVVVSDLDREGGEEAGTLVRTHGGHYPVGDSYLAR